MICMSYEKMVNQSNTPQEIDRLIRACNSDYTLLNVTVLDVWSLVSEKMRESLARLGRELDINEAFGVLKEILLLKKPDVILTLQCRTKEAESPIAKSLCGFAPGTPRPSILQLQGMRPLSFEGSIQAPVSG